MVGACHHNTLRNSKYGVLLTPNAIGAWTAGFVVKTFVAQRQSATHSSNHILKKFSIALQIHHHMCDRVSVYVRLLYIMFNGSWFGKGKQIEKSPSANLFIYQQSTITLHTELNNVPTYFPTFNCIDATHFCKYLLKVHTHTRTRKQLREKPSTKTWAKVLYICLTTQWYTFRMCHEWTAR